MQSLQLRPPSISPIAFTSLAPVTCLPPELWDRIIDLGDSYLICALTCRSWRSRSQYNIFRVVHISDPFTLDKLSKVLQEKPFFGTFVESLYLSSSSGGGKKHGLHSFKHFGSAHSGTPWPYRVLVELSPFLTNLRCIGLSGHKVYLGIRDPPWNMFLSLTDAPKDTPRNFLCALFNSQATLTKLDLSLIRFRTIENFTAIVRSFPQLRHIKLSEFAISDPPDFFSTPPQPSEPIPLIVEKTLEPPCLETLKVSTKISTDGGNVCRWIVDLELASRLAEINLTSIDCHDGSKFAIEVGRLIKACGASLRKLKLELSHVLKLSKLGYFSFETNTSLQCFHLEQHVWDQQDHKRTRRLGWLVDLLSTFPPHNDIRRISIHLNMPLNPHKTRDATIIPGSRLASDFVALDCLFTDTKFKTLQNIKMKVTLIDSWENDSLAAVGSGGRAKGNLDSAPSILPLTSATGILQYEAGSIGYSRIYWDSSDSESEYDSEDDLV